MAGKCSSTAGQRPRDWNPAWMERAISHPDGSYEEGSAYLFAHIQALDEGEPDRAAICLDVSLSLWPKLSPLLRSHYFLEAAFFEARYGGDAAKARAWLDLAGKGLLVEEHTRLRAEAAGRGAAHAVCVASVT